jgi:CheY-like chemotaxis protein/multidrug efflux pump subunit AcrA (membrane-fusion protein)
MSANTILLVDDDETLSRVLRRVLTQQGNTVVEAGNVARALQAARESPPQLGLFDLRLPDGDGVELARKLTSEGFSFPVILMTAYPLRLRDQPELARQFARVLTKPLNLQELRQAIDTALAQAPNDRPVAAALAELPPLTKPEIVNPGVTEEPTVMPTAPARRRRLALAIAAILVLAAGTALAYFKLPARTERTDGDGASAKSSGTAATGLTAKAVSGDPDGLTLPPEVVAELGLKAVAVEPAAGMRPLRLSGFINYDPDYMQRVHALFGGEVIEIPDIKENVRGTTELRKLSFNDRVSKDDLLAVVWSKDLGQMKSTLVDALVHLLFDEETMTRYDALYAAGGTSEAVVRSQRAQISLDRNAVATAERALGVARVPANEIKAVKDEAKRIFDRRGEHDPATEKDWPRVEVRAHMDGTIVEKNFIMGDTVDTSFDMFRIADLSKLAVWASAYEEDLRDLNRLTLPYPWEVRLSADTRLSGQAETSETLNSGFLEKINPAIDPNQHTATLMGRVEPGAAEKGIVGRMVSVIIKLPQPGSTVAVPVEALDEDGETSVVFVQPDADKPYYSMRRVSVVQRLSDVVLVSSHLSEAEKKRGLQELKRGERVVTRQTYLLHGALDDLKNRPQKDGK